MMNTLLLEPQIENQVVEVSEKKKVDTCNSPDKTQRMLAVRDAMEILSGKWKIQIIGVLLFHDKMRFMDLLRVVDGIAAKMLSKELQDLEANQIITRTVLNTKPITVEYEMTAYGHTLRPVIDEIVSWGIDHREKIMRG